MNNLTPKSMIDAIEWYESNADRFQMFDAFYKMRFHGFIDNETWGLFCELWRRKVTQ